jgi:hypothetical protein
MMIKTIVFLLFLITPAFAGDPQFWGNYPPEVHEWFGSVMQPGHEDEIGSQGHSCCGSGDAFEVRVLGEDPATGDIQVIIDEGKTLVPDGTEVLVPKDKIQIKYGNPFPDKVILFMGGGLTVYCLVPNTLM